MPVFFFEGFRIFKNDTCSNRISSLKIRIIKTGIQDDTNIEVLSGLKKGDVVIVGPYTTVTKDLNSGDKIIVSSGIEKPEKK
mgnify:CR=1 FL=1